jgi:hypothetical protein
MNIIRAVSGTMLREEETDYLKANTAVIAGSSCGWLEESTAERHCGP